MKLFFCTLFFVFITFQSQGQLPVPDGIIEINQASANFGVSVSKAGDVNGDGYVDAIVGANLFDNTSTNQGSAYIYYGSAAGLITDTATKLDCNQGFANFGISVSSAGDINNDGYDDVVVGAYLYDNGQTNEGRVFIYHGSPDGISNIPSVTLESNKSNAYFGYSVSSAGDVNGDDYDDLIIGAYLDDNGQTDEGRAYLYLGSTIGINTIPSIILESDQASAYFGKSVSSAGDLNNDGFDDIIIGALNFDNGQSNEGAAFVYLGSVDGIGPEPAFLIESNLNNSYMGNAVSTAGDINNDGFDDLIIGVYQYSNGSSNEGAAFIYLGSPVGIDTISLAILEGNQSSVYFGSSLSGAGDLNDDGYDDIIIGAYKFDNNNFDEGLAMIFHGSFTGINTTPIKTMESNQISAYFGVSVSGVGDLNIDGYDDFIIGANEFDNGETNEGGVFIYYGDSCIGTFYHPDLDGDGYGSSTLSVIVCDPPVGYVEDNLDCNDLDALQNPSTEWFFDSDEDLYYYGDPIVQCLYPGSDYYYTSMLGGSDCDDENDYVFSGAFEYLDGVDNNCDGSIDEGFLISLEAVIESNYLYAQLGYSVASAGDVNGDEYGDVIVGAPGYYTADGAFYIFHGTSSGIDIAPATLCYDEKLYADFGASVSGAGDINGDGYDDVIVGSPSYDNGLYGFGRTYIYHGSPDGIGLSPNVIIKSDQNYSALGNSVSGAGDVNGDGFDDVIIGEYQYSNGQTNEGRLLLFYGSITGIDSIPNIIIEGNQTEARFGTSVSMAGDVNNDGYSDIIIGSNQFDVGESNEGVAFIYHGSPDGLDTIPAVILESNQAYSHFGYSVSDCGDINNDGYDDVVVGAFQYDGDLVDAGAVFIYCGSALGIDSSPVNLILGDQPGSYYGRCVSGAGDINGDGFDDIIVGANLFENGVEDEGKSFVYYGSSVGVNPIPAVVMEGNVLNAEFGTSVSDAGDINNDGISDLVVGAPFYTEHPIHEGHVFIYHGQCPTITFYEDLDNDGYGNITTDSIACSVPFGYVNNNLDCNDSNPLIYPDNFELCNSLDDNCNGLIDDGITETISITAGGPISFCQGGSVLLTANYSGATVQWKKNGTIIPGATSTTYNVTTKGNYSCVTTSACGTAESTPIFVNVIKNPNASISAGGPTTFCAGGSVILTEVAVAGCTYQWYKGATPIAGATSLTYTATTSGNYKCRVTKAATGCYKNSNAIAVSVPCREDLPAGEAGNIIIANTFSLYPNPANNFITIETDFSTEKTIYLTDALGQIVKTITTSENNITIDLQGIAAGVYFIKMEDGMNSVAQKFVKL